MATVTLQPGESQEGLLKRFRRKVVESQILSICRQKRWFVSKGELRRKQKKRAARKLARRVRQRQARER
jgi:small subunit ribosomal protein S21